LALTFSAITNNIPMLFGRLDAMNWKRKFWLSTQRLQAFTFGFCKRQTMKNTILDILTAIGLGLMLCVGLLAYFDILIK
jgi:hypothetical protein